MAIDRVFRLGPTAGTRGRLPAQNHGQATDLSGVVVAGRSRRTPLAGDPGRL